MIDAHIHIDFYDNPGKIIRDIMKNDISAIFVTHLPELYERQKAIMENIPKVFLSVGFHPILVNEYEFKKELFLNALRTTKFIGEVGLDYATARTEKSRRKQKNIFKFICENSNDHILSIHSRLAEKDVLEILKIYNIKHAIFHWYSGETNFIPQIINDGYYFSANPAMLRTGKGRGILKEIPLNRLIVETDGPFSKYNGEIIEPSHLGRVYSEFEAFYAVTDFENIINENMLRLISD